MAVTSIESGRRLPVDYDVFVAQLAACTQTLEKLRSESQTPKIEAMIERLTAAQQRMLEAMRSLPTPYR